MILKQCFAISFLVTHEIALRERSPSKFSMHAYFSFPSPESRMNLDINAASYLRNFKIRKVFILYTCRKISPSLVDHYKYTNWWPRCGVRGEATSHKASCPCPLLLPLLPWRSSGSQILNRSLLPVHSHLPHHPEQPEFNNLELCQHVGREVYSADEV
jgi:hypothetical protein